MDISELPPWMEGMDGLRGSAAMRLCKETPSEQNVLSANE